MVTGEWENSHSFLTSTCIFKNLFILRIEKRNIINFSFDVSQHFGESW